VKGIYLLVIKMPDEQDIRVGSLGLVHFSSGHYAYVGSALGGFKSRLNRHLRKDKKPKWHVDYLLRQDEIPKRHIDNKLQKAAIESIIICETEERVECAIAQAIRRKFDSIPRFGSSDCKCPSHLFFATEQMESGLIKVLNSLGLKPKVLDDLSKIGKYI